MRKFLIILVVVVVAGLAALLVVENLKKIGSFVNTTPAPAAHVAEIKIVDSSKLPEGFPADLPLEAGATITQNYTTINPNGLPLAVREFISKKTLAENFTIYKTSLTAAGWTITNTVNGATIKIIEAQKGTVSLRILIHTDTKNQVLVSIQATTNK